MRGGKLKLNRDTNWLKEHWFLLVVAIAVILLMIYMGYFFATHKKIADKPSYQLTTQALMNRFLASQTLLQSQHKRVTLTKGEVAHQALFEVWQQSAPQARQSAVMLLTMSDNQKPDIPKILDWVQRGGHLVTFSQAALEDKSTNADDSDTYHQYQANENALLTYLGIENRRKDRGSAHEDFPQWVPNQSEGIGTNSLDNNGKPNQPTVKAELATKSLIRLPLTDRTSGTNTSPYVGVVINTDHTTALVTQRFFTKYPQARPIADYDWLTASEQFLSVINPLTASQQAAIIQAKHERPQNFSPATAVILDVNMGKGRLTVINNNQVFTNPTSERLNNVEGEENLQTRAIATTWQLIAQRPNLPPNIAQADNAYLLSYLFKTKQQIWLVPDIEVPSLPKLLWQNLKWACIAVGICILMGLLALPKRFGQRQHYQTDTQTNFFNYFSQVGDYLWQSDNAKALIQENRERLLEHIIARHPQLIKRISQSVFDSVEKKQVCQVVADDIGISRGAVALALFEECSNDKVLIQVTKQFAIVNQHYRR